MNRNKNIFALLAGILLMVCGTIMLFSNKYVFSMLLSSNAKNMIHAFAILQTNILMILGGLFLLLRKTKVAAIMLLVAAVMYFIVAIISISNYILLSKNGNDSISQNVPRYCAVMVLFFVTLLLSAVALFLKRTGALVTCLIAAGCRFLWLIINYSGGISFSAMAVLNILVALLQITALVFAGLYLFGKDDAAQVPGDNYGTVDYGDSNTRF